MTDTGFSKLAEDVVLNIFFKLEDDPRNWARLACVCTKLSSLIRTVCWKIKCSQTIPSVVSDLLSDSATAPLGGWASLHKLAVCCPGLLHAEVLLENSDFGLERGVGPDENYHENRLFQLGQSRTMPSSSAIEGNSEAVVSGSECYFDTVYNASESQDRSEMDEEPENGVVKTACDFSVCKRRKICRSLRSHLASGVWNLSREQGNKLLDSRFGGDCLYICDRPGCDHIEEERDYMLFRGDFQEFQEIQGLEDDKRWES
ncbi:Phytochrome A-associated F-box protein [Camellia lanceoleosa]|uniref:Phytochrome A-associated F-box protein n=1 Tax=Camellia lanceoleosa TaxID=1840588 RepID=A0ACC0FW84_9ERIC|nr:Phytochrome A-associated F-box protein [Camellia lanceoleosa]